MKKSPIVTVVAVGIGAALFFVLARFVAIPSPVPNTNISIQYGLLAFMAALFGPLAGLLIGLIGHALADFSFGWGIWWSWVIASAVFGGLMGIAARKLRLEEGEFSKKDLVGFLVQGLDLIFFPLDRLFHECLLLFYTSQIDLELSFFFLLCIGMNRGCFDLFLQSGQFFFK